MLGTILIIVLVLLLLGALPSWPYSTGWGYYPSGGLGLILIIVVVLILSLLVVLMIGALCFAAMGLGISGLVRSSEGSSAVINAVYLPMAIISGTFFSPKGYPGFLKAIADVLPLTYFTKLTRDLMVRHHHVWSELGPISVVLLWGAIGVVVAIRGFRWQPREG